MNRAFKIQFHNGEADEKPIVTMSVTVNNGKRFKELPISGRLSLITHLRDFQRKVDAFIEDVAEETFQAIQTQKQLNSK